MLKKLVVSFVEALISVSLIQQIKLATPTSYIVWAEQGLVVTLIVLVVVVGLNFLFFKRDLELTLNKIKKIFFLFRIY